MASTNISVVDDNTSYLLIIEEEFKIDQDYKFKFYSAGNKFLETIEAVAEAKARVKAAMESGEEIAPADMALAAEADVDLVILDIHMPKFNIVKAVERIDVISPMAYVIIISAYRDFDTLKSLSNLGIFRFCEKDENHFLTNLRKYIKAAEYKILARKSVLYGN